MMSVSPVSVPSVRASYPGMSSVRLSCSELRFPSQRKHRSVPVRSVGSEAHRIWQGSRAGRVIAVFRRSFYVQCDEGVICFGLVSLGKGPLHVLLDLDQSGLIASIAPGQLISFDQASSQSPPGHPKAEAVQASVEASGALYTGKIETDDSFGFAERHIEILRACGAMSANENGFGWLLGETVCLLERGLSEGVVDENAARHNAVDRGLRQYVFPAIQTLYGWLAESRKKPDTSVSCKSGDGINVHSLPCGSTHANPLSGVQKLLGAGSGLTPAGDDLLAGIMLALHCIHRADLVATLWQTLEPSLAYRTNVISSAHLRLAARGQCSESMLQLVEQLTDARTQHSSASVQCIARNVQALANNIGASSGWDTLTGMSLVIRATIDDHSTHYAK